MQLSNSLTPRSVSSSNYLLRQYGGAAAAYSLQRLDTSVENVVRARRSTDDAEADFTAQEVSGGSLREFALNNDADLIRFADQAVAADERMYFDGSNDYVRVSGLTSSASYFGACTIEATVYAESPSTTQVVWSLGSDCYRLYASAGTWKLNGVTNTSVAVVSGIVTLAVDYDASGQAIEFRVDGVTEWTGTSAAGTVPSTTFDIGARAGGLFFKGLIYDFSVTGSAVKNFAFNGYGNTDADWEDQVGSNDGTVQGSPALFSGQGFDAYVTTLYDQSGNGRNATQATAASQPQIVADGVVVTDGNGNPSMDFDGTDDKLGVTGEIVISGNNTASWSGFSVQEIASADIGFVYGNSAGGGIGTALRSVTGPTSYTVSNATTSADYIARTPAAFPELVSSCYNNGDAALRINGGGTPVSGSYTYGFATLDFTIGDWPNSPVANSALNGKISEIIIYLSDKSTDRAKIEANIASRYGITLV